MKVDCGNCGRSFELDDGRVENVIALQCMCGNRLPLQASVGGPGQRLGKYILLNRIATGGMGEIFYGKVSGIEGFEKEVAIKKMLSHLSADRDFINMMVKEAKLTVLLNHPNIVGVYDLAKEGDEYYIAMEYVPGVTVGAILEGARSADGLLPFEVPVHITMQILRGLGYAHNLPGPAGERLTILHRDITPQNILVTRHAYVKITDFGIAKAVNEISTTSPGMIKGKLGYIAPEQLEGREPDQRVDLFCAGILLWEMLAVRRLFKGTSEIDTFRLISDCKIPPMAQVRNDVPQALEAVIVRALARDPAQRYARAEDFYTALNQAIYPRTADDFAEMTQLYFAEHPEYFTAVEAHKGVPEDDAPESTRSLRMPLPGPENLLSVTKFLRAPNYVPPEPVTAVPKGGRGAAVAAVAAVLLAVVVGSAVWWLRGPGVAAPSAPSQISTMTPQPPPVVQPPVAPATPAPSAPPVAPAAPPARREAPVKALTGGEIQATVNRHESEISKCVRDIDKAHTPAQVNAKITIDPSGKVSDVEFSPPVDQASIDHCLSHSLKGMRFRRHTSELQVTIPLRFKVL